MRSGRIPSLIFAIAVIACGAPSKPLAAQQTQPPPDAPQPQSPAVHAARSKFRLFPRDLVVDPDEQALRINARQKYRVFIHDEVSLFTLLSASASAGYSQLRESDPKYGSDSRAFGQRFGAAMIRQGSNRFFSDAVYPSILHQDPRYYRQATGSPWKRGLHAAVRSVLTRGDSGKTQPDVSSLLGRATMAALTLAYYPSPSANGRVAAQTFGFSFLTNIGSNLGYEFLPDLTEKVLHHRME